MHPKRFTRRSLFWGAILVAGLGAAVTRGQQPLPVGAQPPKPLPTPGPTYPDVVVDRTGTLHVPLNGAVIWAPDLPDLTNLIDIAFSNEGIVQLKDNPTKGKTFILTGKTPGLTQITFFFKGGLKRVFDVIVEPDLGLLRSSIHRVVPTAAVDAQAGIATKDGQVIILSGYVASPQDAEVIAKLAATFAGKPGNVINAIQVGGGQQVQIDVVVASVDRNMARTRGLDFSIGGQTANFQSIVSGLLASSIGQQGIVPTVSPNANLQLAIVPANFFLAMQALRTEGVAKFLAEPKVVTQTGRQASFRAGGQQAILSSTSGITGPGVTLVPFGTELDVTPIVYGNGMIWLEINPRITAVSQALGITVGGAQSPGFTEQNVRVTVMLESGQTYAIGGLIQNSIQASSSKVPVLGDLPFLGVAFSTVNHQQTESELVIMVTPRLVGPMNCDQVPKRVAGRESRNPDDYELFLENILEAPRGQRKVWNGRCYNAAYKCDPTSAIFPCVGGVCNGQNKAGAPATGHPNNVPPASGGMSGVPATLPPIPQLPSGGATAPPVVPGSPVNGIGAMAEPLPGTYPAGPPPVIIVPDVPQN